MIILQHVKWNMMNQFEDINTAKWKKKKLFYFGFGTSEFYIDHANHDNTRSM